MTGGDVGSLRARIGRELFPRPIPADGGFSRAEGTLLLGGLVALGTVLVLLRLGTEVFERVWAEDGPVYLAGAIDHGFWFAVFKPYAGYLVVAPRLIGAVAGTILPLQWASAVIVVLAALLNAVSGVAVWFGSAGQVPDRRLRAALVVAIVLAAGCGQETLDSGAYAPWFMLCGTFWLLFLWPRTNVGAGAAAFFALLTGLSTPGVWFFLPVAVLRVVSGPTRKAWIVLAGFAAGAVVQVPVVLSQQQEPSLYTGRIWSSFLQRVVDGGLLGQRLGGNLWQDLGWPFVIVVALLAIIVPAACLRRAALGTRWCVAVLLATSFVMFVVSVYQRGISDAIFWRAGESNGLAGRYVTVPAALLVSAVVVAVQGYLASEWGRRRSPRLRRGIVGATLAVIAIAVAFSYDMSYSGYGVPNWRDALEQAADKCVAHRDEVGGIPTEPPPFGVIVRCQTLERYAAQSVRDAAR